MRERLDGRVALFAISSDPRADSQRFSAAIDAWFPLLEDVDQSVMRAFGVLDSGMEIALPAVFVVARDGRVLFQAVGDSPRDRVYGDRLLGILDEQLTE